MSKNNLYLNGAVHLDHSHSLEINQQNLSAEDLNRIIHAFMHGDAPGHTEKPASSPIPVYAEEVVCETDGQQESEALTQARLALEQARKQEAEALAQARQAQEQARLALEQARLAQEQARQAQEQAQAQTAQAQEQARQAQTAQAEAQTAQSQAQTAQAEAQTAQAEAQAAQSQAQTAQEQAEASLTLAEWLKGLIHELRQEGVLKRRYDFTWVMWGVNCAAGRMLFGSSQSFLDYLTDCGIDQLPSIASLQSHNQNFSLSNRPDQWTFRDNQDEQERQRRIRVGKFTIRSYRVNILTNR